METIIARSIFNHATGFAKRAGFTYTCNPYLGCSFGCSYCYAAFLPQNRQPVNRWGKWFKAKKNAVELAEQRAPMLAGQPLYLATVTDPYMPVEGSLRLTRGILQTVLPHQPRLLVQTRGPLVVRDVDLLEQFQSLRVNISIPTDDESVRETFEPKAPRLEARWQALATLKSAGIPIGVCVTPMLPISDPEAFAARIAALEPDLVVTMYSHNRKGGVGAHTRETARRLLAESDWTPAQYEACRDAMRRRLNVCECESGFVPPPPAAGGELCAVSHG